MQLSLAGRNAVVTGGAHGIGLAIAQTLEALDASVTVLDIEAGEWHGLRLHCDVTVSGQLEACLEQLPAAPDVVVANAGIVRPNPLNETTDESWDRTIAVNLSGVFRTVRAAAARMKSSGSIGAIIITASTNSYDGEPDLIAYNASKAGLLGIVHTAANELGPWGIRVNAVCPGLIRTRLTESHFANSTLLKDYFRHIPLGRGGDPGEVARAVAFLASDWASYITGATLFVDGGQMASKFGTWSEDWAAFENGRWNRSK